MSIDLRQGDCLELLKDIPDGSVDLIITSPPYYNAREYSQYSSYIGYLDTMVAIFEGCRRLMNPASYLVIVVSPVIEAREARNKKSKRYAIPQNLTTRLQDSGFEFIDEIIWRKPDGAAKNRVSGFNRYRKPKTYKPNCVTESILVFQRDDSGIIDKYLKEDSLITGDISRTNVWDINPETRSLHSAAFPLVLVDRIVRYYSYEQEIVLDPFMGSGTTGVACINTNRDFIGIELDEDYFKIAQDRIEQAKQEATNDD